jgi:hypothetical protein
MHAAKQYAELTGGKTLEMTFSGKAMTFVNPILPRSVSSPIWGKLSENFARGAIENVDVFHNLQGVRRSSIWATQEFPILKEKGIDMIFHNVSPIFK